MSDLNNQLLEASKKGNIDKVKQLIQSGADVHHRNNYGNTALIYASSYGNVETVKYLIQEGADVNHNYGWTALLSASGNGHLDITKELIKAGADINYANNDGNTALILASQYGNLENFKYLIQSGADLNHTNKFGATALTLASKYGNLEIVKYLIQLGADYKPVKNNPKIKPIIDNIIKEYSNNMKDELTNNYLTLERSTPQINISGKVKSQIPKELLLRCVYEVPYQQLCSNINRDYPPLKLIALAELLDIDYNPDISWIDLCGKVNKTLYLML